ncbi:DegT/DnrJ/EryC1/StrS family aminotransferase (plasmid) [Halorientalis pallida]|uniref:DegT/DnrJ/EryC1/StrS family aminotransferase n=1 Tax=Halorientalis pallida TaxID=2479928 RepID=UPI003C6F7E31
MDEPVEFTDIYVDEAMVDRATEVLRSGRYVKGPMVERFEAAFAEFCGTDHAVGVASGTDAIYLALKAAGVEPGDDVFVPAHTFFATVSPVLELGANPVFVDHEPVTYTMDALDLGERLRAADQPAAVVPVHIYGHPADMGAIREVADAHDLAVIEDACQAHGATYEGEPVGSLGDAGAFSFYPSKNMTVAGDGGMITTDDPDLAREARMLRNHGRNGDGEHVRLGLNHRLSELHAALGHEQLGHVDDWNEHRRSAAERYTDRLTDVDAVTPPQTRSESEHVYHLYVIQVPDRADLRDALDDAGVQTDIHYRVPAHEHLAVERHLDESPRVPRTETLTDRILSLPMHPRITDTEIDRVCAAIERHYDR